MLEFNSKFTEFSPFVLPHFGGIDTSSQKQGSVIVNPVIANLIVTNLDIVERSATNLDIENSVSQTKINLIIKENSLNPS